MENNKKGDETSDLDSLLDEALADFNKPMVTKPKTDQNANGLHESTATANEWTEEFIQEATKNFEKTMRQMMASQQTKPDDSETLPNTNGVDFDNLTKEFVKLSVPHNESNSTESQDFAKCLNETMKQFKKNEEDVQAPPSADELGNLFENYVGGNENNMQGMFSLMQSMLENLLSKEVLYEPIKDIVDKFPGWLADNRPSLSAEDFARYSAQYDAMKEVTQVFEATTDSDSKEMKEKRFEEVLRQMQKLQDLGQPPAALMGDFSNPLDVKSDMNTDDLSQILESVSQENGLNGSNGHEQCSLM